MAVEKCRYKIIPDKRLVIRYYRGQFSLDDLILCLENNGLDPLYDPTFNVINDLRDGESNIKIGEINKIFGYVKGHKLLYGKRRSVFLTKTPKQTVFSMMLGLLKYESLVSIKTFNTLLEAIVWLGFSDYDLEAIEGCINDLKR